MLLPGCRLTCDGLLVASVLLGANACGSNEGNSTAGGSSSSSTSTTTTTPTTTIPTTSGTPPMYDEIPWEPIMAKTCDMGSDCCENHLPCPGPFPDNWVCNGGECIQGVCGSNEDCIVPGFECLEVNFKPSCVLPCEDADDCQAMGVGCNGKTDGVKKFCLEGPENF